VQFIRGHVEHRQDTDSCLGFPTFHCRVLPKYLTFSGRRKGDCGEAETAILLLLSSRLVSFPFPLVSNLPFDQLDTTAQSDLKDEMAVRMPQAQLRGLCITLASWRRTTKIWSPARVASYFCCLHTGNATGLSSTAADRCTGKNTTAGLSGLEQKNAWKIKKQMRYVRKKKNLILSYIKFT